MKFVNETAAGKIITVYVVMKGKRHIANVHVHFGNTVTVDVWSFDGSGVHHHGRAGGGGYDRETAALSGAVIDGHTMTDHCEARQPLPKGLDHFPKGFKPRKGYTLSNYVKDLGYGSCHKEAGLGYLKGLGYTVIRAL